MVGKRLDGAMSYRALAEGNPSDHDLYDWAKAQDELVEVIYATMDGCVYFVELETGKETRDKLEVGIPFKGAGALDPRGYPILYLGTGDSYRSAQRKGRSMAYSLIDFTRLMEVGVDRDDFAYRNWHAYDSSPLVDAETDTLIVPGENGILYTVRMNTQYDPEAGTLTMNPGEIVKQRYDADRVDVDRNEKYLYGYESSTVAWGRIFVPLRQRRLHALHRQQHDGNALGCGPEG